MEINWFIPFVAFFASVLTFFSGFGLGTMLLAAFLVFFPIQDAIAMTAMVHLANSVWKLSLNHKGIDKRMVIQFGLVSMCFGALGAWLLGSMASLNTIMYELNYFSLPHEVTMIQMTVGILIMVFAVFELIDQLSLQKVPLWLGGAISGFFGGLSGHQGALRTAFLIKRFQIKEALISTTALIAVLTDVFRLSVYSMDFSWKTMDGFLIGTCMLSAFFGVWIGGKLLKKTSYVFLKYFVACSLILLGIAMLIGLI